MTADPVQRRLAAILAADVAGYSRLMGEDEEGTLAALIAHRTELIEPCIAEHRGRVVKTTGDGLLAEFASVVDAVRCAVAFQAGMTERNREVADDHRIEFRIGVNLGDVIVQDDDVYGDGVNIAARLEGLAEAGGVTISGMVHDAVRGKLTVGFEDLGDQQVKNIAEPVRTYRIRAEGAKRVSQTDAGVASPLTDKPSIAVLPFDNLSDDPEQEYFSDGITEDIITALCRVRWFLVVARNSSFSYKGQSPNVRQVAKELGVQYVLEGSVRKAGHRIRISAQLIEGSSGNHIWAEKYDRDLDDIFGLQDELTLTLVGAIEPELGKFQQQLAKARAPESLAAWDAYQRGMWHVYSSSRTQEDVVEARKFFERAMQLDPNFGLAYAGYAETYALNALLGIHEEDCAKALPAARKAIQLDASDANAHYAVGRVLLWVNKEPKAAIPHFETAISLNPSLAIAHNMLARCLAMSGTAEKAILHNHRAVHLSPRDPLIGIFYAALAHANLFLKKHDDAIEWANKALQFPGTPWPAHAFLASALGHLGRKNEAERALNGLLEFQPGITASFVRENLPITHSDYMKHLLDGLRKAGLQE